MFLWENFLQKNISNLFLKSCRCIRRIKYRVFLFGHGCNKNMESQEKLGKFRISSFLFFFRINIIWLSKFSICKLQYNVSTIKLIKFYFIPIYISFIFWSKRTYKYFLVFDEYFVRVQTICQFRKSFETHGMVVQHVLPRNQIIRKKFACRLLTFF